jgi:hypothetical protein
MHLHSASGNLCAALAIPAIRQAQSRAGQDESRSNSGASPSAAHRVDGAPIPTSTLFALAFFLARADFVVVRPIAHPRGANVFSGKRGRSPGRFASGRIWSPRNLDQLVLGFTGDLIILVVCYRRICSS